MTEVSTETEPERVIKGTLHDLPNPLARAYAMAMTIGVVVDEDFDEEGAAEVDLLAMLRMDVDDRGIRDVITVPAAMEDTLKAEAIFFVCGLVVANRSAGLDFSPWCYEGENRDQLPMIAITRTRTEPDEKGYSRLAVMMATEAGIENPTSFEIADPPYLEN